jgi:serine O-acetyltransferase
MNEHFIEQIHNRQKACEAVPPNEEIANWTNNLISLLFPERSSRRDATTEETLKAFLTLQNELLNILEATDACTYCNKAEKAATFFDALPELYRVLNTDIEVLLQGDPAAQNRFEIIRAYPGFTAISFYRVAHALLRLNIPLLPRIITEHAHSKTGIDIHPGATIGEYFFIDHGTGIVVGETTHIGNHVKLYQGVTLGALSVDKNMASKKRHPTIEDHVIIYSGTTILGGDTVIGHNSVVGGNVWLTRSIPPFSTVYNRPDIKVVEYQKDKNP